MKKGKGDKDCTWCGKPVDDNKYVYHDLYTNKLEYYHDWCKTARDKKWQRLRRSCKHKENGFLCRHPSLVRLRGVEPLCLDDTCPGFKGPRI